MNQVRVKQLDMAGISGALLAANFVTGNGTVVRSIQTGDLVLAAQEDAFEAQVQGQILNISGQVEASGQYLLTGRIEPSGAYLLSLLEATGQTLYNSTTGFSSNLAATGSALQIQINNLSGSLVATGALIANNINNLSGSFDQTGANLQNQINNLTGTLLVTGRGLELNLLNLSGSLNNTGQLLATNIANLTGSLDQTGAALRSDLNAYLAGATTIDSLSGAVTVTGSGIVVSILQGQTLYLSGSSLAASVGRIVAINGLTGNLFITGAGSITVINSGASGIYVSGNFITASQTGAFADSGNLTASGIALWNRDESISGALNSLIVASNAGVSSVNNLSGNLTIVGTGGIGVTTGVGQIIVSGAPVTAPHWVTMSPDIFTPASFDDDFDSTYLDNKWTGINVNVDSSGISNSHFYAYGKAAASSINRSIFAQGITTGADWEISMKCDFLPKFINNQSLGLFMGNASSNKNTTLGYEYSSSASQLVVRHYTGYNSTAAVAIEGAVSGYTSPFKNAYFRLQSRSNLMNFDHSNDGVIWRTIRNFTYTGIAPTIDQVGFHLNPSASQIILAVDWFRTTGLS